MTSYLPSISLDRSVRFEEYLETTYIALDAAQLA